MTRVAIPTPSPTLPALMQSVAALKQGYDISTGQRGPKVDSVVTWQDLVYMGLIAPDDPSLGNIPSTWNNWVAYNPVITPGSGAFTTATAAARWKRASGLLIFFTTTITITTNGTAATDIVLTLPTVANSAGCLAGKGASNVSIRGDIAAGSNKISIYKYDGTYPGGTGATLTLSGCYESQT